MAEEASPPPGRGGGDLDLEATLSAICERAQELTGADGASVLLIEEDELRSVAGSGFMTPYVETTMAIEGTLAGWSFRRGEPGLVHDAETDSRAHAAFCRDHGIRSVLAVPVQHADQAIGVIQVLAARPDAFDENDARTLDLVALGVSAAVSNAAAFEAKRAQVETLARFRKIFDGAPIGLIRLDAEGRVVEANDAIERMLGYSEAELGELGVADITDPRDLDRCILLHGECIEGKRDSYEVEKRYIRKDGEMIWGQAKATVLERDPDGRPVFTIMMVEDITDRKQAELALRENTTLSRIVETQRDIAAVGLHLDAVLTLITERATALTRGEGAAVNLIDGDDIVMRAATGIVAPALGSRRPLERSVTFHAAHSGETLLIEDSQNDTLLDPKIVELTGERSHVCVPLFQGGKVVGSIQVMSTSETDRLDEEDRQTMELLGVVLSSAVTSASEFEAKRKQVEALSRFETIYQDAPIGIGMLNLEGRFIDTNAAMRAITGFTAGELAEMLVSDYTHPEDVDQMAADFTGLLAGELDSYRREYRLFRKDGETVWIDVAVAAVHDADGRVQGAITMAQDTSDRRAAEEQLRQSQKAEAIGQLSAGIAHDFNNLLMGVLGYASLARAEVDDGTRLADCLDRIAETGDRAASLTKQLLAFGRRQTLQPREIDLNQFVSETLSMLARVLGEHIEIVSNLEPELPSLRADPTQIQQVLFNLALNARDAMPGGGLLTIGTHSVVLAESELPGGLELEPGSYVLLTVEDTGEGMTSEIRERIFEPFFTTKDVGEGTGLGLPSVYGIVKQSRGDIEVTSRPGEGSAFRIYLPASEPIRSANGVPDRRRILVVEDADVVRDLLVTLLDDQGYEVVASADPQEALDLAQREAPFDVLLTDIVLSGMSGVHLAARLQEHQPRIRVLYMSGYQRDERIDPALLIPKPFTNDELVEKLESALLPAAAA